MQTFGREKFGTDVNTAYIEQLLQRCRESRAWPDLRYSPEVNLTLDRIGLLCFAQQVRAWTDELEDILQALRRGHANDFSPQRCWSLSCWSCYYNGRLAAVKMQSNTAFVSISGFERDNTPGYARFSNLLELVSAQCRDLLERHGLVPSSA